MLNRFLKNYFCEDGNKDCCVNVVISISPEDSEKDIRNKIRNAYYEKTGFELCTSYETNILDTPITDLSVRELLMILEKHV